MNLPKWLSHIGIKALAAPRKQPEVSDETDTTLAR